MPIPPWEEEKGQLPVGEHVASWEEVEQRFAWNHRRRQRLEALKWVIERLAEKGVTDFWIDGSFVTSMDRPQDVDVVYGVPPGSDPSSWDRFSPQRMKELKKEFGVHLWPYPSPQMTARGMVTILDWFCRDEDDDPKGILKLEWKEDSDDSK